MDGIIGIKRKAVHVNGLSLLIKKNPINPIHPGLSQIHFTDDLLDFAPCLLLGFVKLVNRG